MILKHFIVPGLLIGFSAACGTSKKNHEPAVQPVTGQDKSEDNNSADGGQENEPGDGIKPDPETVLTIEDHDGQTYHLKIDGETVTVSGSPAILTAKLTMTLLSATWGFLDGDTLKTKCEGISPNKVYSKYEGGFASLEYVLSDELKAEIQKQTGKTEIVFQLPEVTEVIFSAGNASTSIGIAPEDLQSNFRNLASGGMQRLLIAETCDLLNNLIVFKNANGAVSKLQVQ